MIRHYHPDYYAKALFWFGEWAHNSAAYSEHYRDSLEQLMWTALIQWAAEGGNFVEEARSLA